MKKIVIANRGEIALRIMKTARKMSLQTVAVYSEADRGAPHVQYADQAVLLGPPPSNQSYLLEDKIIKAAKDCGADAIHPGYGFLSENAGFAEKVEANDLTWIGPGSKAIEVMGDKLASKATVKKYDIPLVPGIDEAITDTEKAKEIAKEIGYPVLIKASAGGGGKGMRVVHEPKNLKDQMNRAISEAKSAFGNGAVFIEKYITSPRHIEIQVLSDKHGNYRHFFERECSIQRRHQKVVEEAPSVVLDPALREKMGQAAIDVAKSCDYVGAGTVEFIFDENKNFYFLEMNTRLQVEHPVTELITGFDLVEQQIRVARGEKLSFEQKDLSISGHALELRVYAEDPLDDFLPSTGNLEKYKLPEGNHIRIDNGFYEGMDVPIYYDPMLAKLIVYGKNREEALHFMQEAIDSFEVEGVKTTLAFGKFVVGHESFRSGNFDTHFVKNHYSPESLQEEQRKEARIAALLALKKYLKDQEQLRLPITD